MAKKPRFQATVGPFVFSFPHLTSPDTEGKFADNKYKVAGLTDPGSPVAKAAQKAIAEAIKSLGVPKDSQHPLKKETEKNEAGKRVPTGKLKFTAKSQYAPAICDASGKPIPEKSLKKLKIGAGSEGLLQGYFTPYTKTEKIKDAETGEIDDVEVHGLSFTLTGVQLIKLVQGGAQGANFSAYEGGGFTYEGGDTDEDDGLPSIPDESDDADEDDNGGLDI